MGVDVGSNDESNNIEEGYPGVLGEELLSEGQAQGRGNPADLHDRHEASPNGSANLVDGPRTGDNSHGGQVDAVLDGGNLGKREYIRQSSGHVIAATTTYNQIANEDLENLGLETCATVKEFLQDANENVAEGGR